MTIILTSCSSKKELDFYLNKIDIKLNDNYKVLSNESSLSIGDNLVNFKIQISDNDYLNLIRHFENVNGFQIVQTNQTPIDNFKGPNPNLKKTAWTRDGVYIYQVIAQDTIGSGYESFSIYLNKDKTLDFSYADE